MDTETCMVDAERSVPTEFAEEIGRWLAPTFKEMMAVLRGLHQHLDSVYALLRGQLSTVMW